MSKSKNTSDILSAIHVVGSLEQAPQHAMELARIVVNWTALEQRLSIAYSILTNTEAEVASTTMHQISNTHQKITIISALAKSHAPNEQFKDELLEIIKICKDLSSKRSKYVHKQWMVRGDGEVFLIDFTKPRDSQNHTLPIKLQDMQKVTSDIRETRAVLDRVLTPYLQH